MMAKRTPIDSATKDYEGGADNYPIKPMRPLVSLYRRTRPARTAERRVEEFCRL
jgi:hypothetical protein